MRNRFISKWLASGASALTLSLAMAPGVALAQERATDPSTLDILAVLVDKGVLSRADADTVLAEARKRSESREAVVRVPYVPEALREQITKDVREEVVKTAKAEGWAQPGTLPTWLSRINFYGDVRARGEAVMFEDGNAPLVLDINAINADGGYNELEVLPYRNTVDKRYRGRVRARFGADIAVSKNVEAGFRFVTGDLDEPTMTESPLAHNFGRIQAGFDRAYLRIKPVADDSMFAGTSVTFGKFENPFLSTEAMFDRDVQFEGAVARVAAHFGSDETAPYAFATGGIFPLEDYAFTNKSKYMLGGQIGVGAQPVDGLRLHLAGAYYNYNGLQGEYNTPSLRDNDFTAPSRVQFGNSTFNLRNDATAVNTVLFGLASEFSLAAIYANAEIDINHEMIASVEFEAARNLAFKTSDLLARRVPASSGDTLLHGRLALGHRDMDLAGAWRFSAGYRRVEADATPDLFTDSDFGLGGTDQKGFVIGASWAPLDRLLLTGTWASARTIDVVAPSGLPASPIDSDIGRLDLTIKF